jgi:hypothetical protein
MSATTNLRLAAAMTAAFSICAAASNEGMATHFLGVGFPYGACGVSDEVAATEGAIDTLTGQGNPFDYVALNVYNTPGDYASATHPLTGPDTVKMGTYRNGLNCGRWIKLSLGDTCDGANDGAINQPFCRGGTGWHPNAYTGAGIYAVVFDQCTDGNAWCRDSKYHLDLHTPILGKLRKDGILMPPLATAVLDANGKPVADANNPWAIDYQVKGFTNPKVVWDFVPAPNYQGEPRFYFSQGSKLYYMRLMVTHLPNGLHGLEQLVGGKWQKASMEGDAGQLWILPDASSSKVTIRLTDAQDQLVMDGRTWTLEYPTSCGTECTKPATSPASIKGEGGGVSIARTTMRPAALKATRGMVEIRAGLGEGWLELFTLSGQFLSRSRIVAGSASIPANKGLVLVRWKVGATQGAQTLVVD